MLDKRLHLQGECSLGDSSTENSSADIDPYTDNSSGRESFSEEISSEVMATE
jgi:hypothetical protein